MPSQIPPLPRRLNEVTPAVAVGTGLWLLACVGLFVAFLLGARPLDEWFWTCLSGFVLGLVGYSIFRWQRAAARRGSRSAQRGVD